MPASVSARVSSYEPHNAAEGYTKPGLRLYRCALTTFCVEGPVVTVLIGLYCDWKLFGNGPHESREFTSNSDGDDVRMFASGHQLAVTFAQPDLGFPADVLDDLGLFSARGPRPSSRSPLWSGTGRAKSHKAPLHRRK